MTKEMLINTVEGQESRIAIVQNGTLEELYIERVSSASRVGNIYKGRVTNVEPSIQAAFVDFGLSKNGFLHISDVQPQFFPKSRGGAEPVGKKRRHCDRPPIQECLRRGQEIVVQMTKEGIGTKGPTLTTYLSIPGRLLVTMPGMSCLGVSRKVEDEEMRLKARELLADLKLPVDMGFILRTAGIGRNKRELQRDLNYLLRLWKAIKQRIKTAKAPAEIYQESDLVTRTIRDIYNADIARIVCDSEAVAWNVKEFLDMAMPRTKHIIDVYTGSEGLFQEYGLEEEIEKIYSRRVELPSGGSLVIDQTEALVAIDVNSGRAREHADAETTAMKINIEAAGEITRQLRLRDLGGVIIIDFIDMRLEKNHRAVERTLRDALKIDRAKTKILRMSSLGIVEMTRQRVRPSLKQSIYRTCEHCLGTGLVKSDESLSLMVMRQLKRTIANPNVETVKVHCSPTVAHHLANFQRHRIGQLENQSARRILICSDDSILGDNLKIVCTNNRDSEIAWEQPHPGKKHAQAVKAVSLDTLKPPPALRQPPEPPDQLDLDIDSALEANTERESLAEFPKTEQIQIQQTPPAAAASTQQPKQGVQDSPLKRRRGRRGGRKHKKKTINQSLDAKPSAGKDQDHTGLPKGSEEAQLPQSRSTDAVVAKPGHQVSQPPYEIQADKSQTTPSEAIPPHAETKPVQVQAGQKKPRRRGSRGGRRKKRAQNSQAQLAQPQAQSI